MAGADAFTASGRLLIISKGGLHAGQTYAFRVSGYPESDPSSAGYGLVRITTALPPLVVRVRGGNRLVSTVRDFALDGRGSYDPGNLVGRDKLQYAWHCTLLPQTPGGQELPCRKAANNKVLSLPAAARTTVSAAHWHRYVSIHSRGH